MADEGKKAKVTESINRFSNFLKYNLRRAGLGKWHEVDVEASPNIEVWLKKQELMDELKTRMQLLQDIERMWNEFQEERNNLMKLYVGVGYLRLSEITTKESLLAKRGTRIAAKDWSPKKRELFEIEFQKVEERNTLLAKKQRSALGQPGQYAGEIPKLRDNNNYYSEWFKFKVKVDSKDIEDYYPVPLNVPFRFWSSILNDRDYLATEYLQGYFGFQNVPNWKNAYEEFFRNVCDEVSGKATGSPEEKSMLESNLTIVAKSYTEAVNKIFTEHVTKREDEIFRKTKEISNKASVIENARNSFTTRVPQSLKITIYYRHTYLIVNPIKIEWPVFEEPAGQDASARFKYKYGDYAEDILKMKKYLKSEEKFEEFVSRTNYPFALKSGESVIGLDENGWPLEVADQGYEWPPGSGQRFQKGTVLKDIFNGDPDKRVVPGQFIEPMDTLFMTNCIHNEWDAVRDDLRDGRYHANSLTVVDYLMAENPSIFKDLKGNPEWKKMGEEKLQGSEGELFRSFEMYYLNNTLAVEIAKKGKRRPSNIIPAFDKRAIGKKYIHLGRKYYYQGAKHILEVDDRDLQDPIAQLATGPFISTRGLSQYLITKVISGMKYFEHARKRLKVIADQQGSWYDYGPRPFGRKGTSVLGPWG